jgi:adenylate cyclase
LLSVVPQTHSLVLVTYRPEYRGALNRAPGAQTIALAPLDDTNMSSLITELLGLHSSVAGLICEIAERAAGNPFFAEEIVRDLADRGVLAGERGAYTCPAGATSLIVPATLQAAIAARIDRLETTAKRTLNAAAVIGLRFPDDLLATLVDNAAVPQLIHAELIDQVTFTPRSEYAFRHPLIRTVAYQSQLRSERTALHRRLATTIEQSDPESVDENAALLAEHLEAADQLRDAFGWHMRAAKWSFLRDFGAARMSWQRARKVADRLPTAHPDRAALRIAPRALLCGSAFRAGGAIAGTGFDELSNLAAAADDKMSLAIGMAGQVMALLFHAHYRESSQLATEFIRLVESIGDPTLTVALLSSALGAKIVAGEVVEVLRLAQSVIDLADGDARKGNLTVESPLVIAMMVRATALACVGDLRWKADLEQASTMGRAFNPVGHPVLLLYKYGIGLANRGLLVDTAVLRESAETLELAEQWGDDLSLQCARFIRGLTLVHSDSPQHQEGFELLAKARDDAVQQQSIMVFLSPIDIEFGKEQARTGGLDGAIELLRAVVEDEYATGEAIFRAAAVTALVESLLQRGTEVDTQEAEASIERLTAVPTEPGFALYDVALLRLRALVARVHGDEPAYRDFVVRYGAMAKSIGFEGHMAMAAAMI